MGGPAIATNLPSVLDSDFVSGDIRTNLQTFDAVVVPGFPNVTTVNQ